MFKELEYIFYIDWFTPSSSIIGCWISKYWLPFFSNIIQENHCMIYKTKRKTDQTFEITDILTSGHCDQHVRQTEIGLGKVSLFNV